MANVGPIISLASIAAVRDKGFQGTFFQRFFVVGV